MATVTYDDRSFLVDGERIWLVSGSVHYFRTPAALWRDRLLKAKRAGLNCVSTYVAWNLHEPAEGQWDFTGDRDILEFVRAADEFGLYVILRPGPHIGAEWDFGGLPSWLTGKTGIAYRTNNAAFLHYFDKYFSNVLPRLADQQVTRGGNIILIQGENEYYFTTMPDSQSYLEFVDQLIRRAGFEIPIINCNSPDAPRVVDSAACVNLSDNPAGPLKAKHLRQPNSPKLVTELRTGGPDRWGGPHNARTARDVARTALEVLGCGGQFNYYMWHGGTNFAFWGARLPGGGGAYQTTSYDYDAPLAEGGGLTDTYRLTRLVNLLASHMGPFLAASTMGAPGVNLCGASETLNIAGPWGRWAVVTSGGRDEITETTVSLPDGTELRVSLELLGATAVPVGLALTSAQRLDYTNLMPPGLFGEKILVLHGPSDWPGRVSINGKERTEVVPADDEIRLVEHEDMLIVLISSDLAMRTWVLEEGLVFGPDFVGESLEELVHPPDAGHYGILNYEGQLTQKKLKPVKVSRPSSPRLGQWSLRAVCQEPIADDLEWQKIDRPRDVDRLGAAHGYTWYRIEIDQPRPRKRHLFLPDCQDRAVVFLNGARLGVWERTHGGRRAAMPASLRKGRNVLALLVDNLGRACRGSRMGELKGLFGPVYDAKPLHVTKFKLKRQDVFPRRIIPRQFSHAVAELEKLPLWSAEVSVPLTKVTPIHLSFDQLPHPVAVLCNDRVAELFPTAAADGGEVTVVRELKKGRNLIKLLIWGEVDPKALDSSVVFHSLVENLSAGATCLFRPWVVPAEAGEKQGRSRPAWFGAKFRCDESDVPLFIKITGARKGQIFLNGHNVGRFWDAGPQEWYYLPECWLADQNELLLFDEFAKAPTAARLAYRPAGPYRD